jgi:hypothetical protein
MNATKAVYKLLWDVVIENLVKNNGFRTPHALLAARNCSNHHKSWKFMNILLFDTQAELLRTFILHCFNDNPVKVSEFYKFIEYSKSPHFRFMTNCLLNYVFALYVFRCSIRRANYNFMSAGHSKFLKVYSTSGNNSKVEGGDFVLENINRKTKRWMPPSCPI